MNLADGLKPETAVRPDLGPLRPQARRWNLFLGAACAAVLHAGLLYWPQLFPSAPAPRPAKVEEDAVILMEMPPIEPEKPEVVEELAEAASEPSLAPPMLLDLPRVVPINAFTQPLAPPQQSGIQPGHTLLTIPMGRTGAGLGQGLRNLFDVDSLDQRPVRQAAPPPDYPLELRRNKIAGDVTVEFIISTEGNVLEAQVMDAAHHALEGPALRTVQRWKFRPGRKAGRPVNTRVKQVINFNLEDAI